MEINLTDKEDISGFLEKEWNNFFKSKGIEKKIDYYSFKVEEDGQTMAAAILNIKDNIAFLEDFVVGENYQEKGMGKRLLQNIEKKAKQENCRKILLKTSDIHEKAKKFYILQGYKQIATLPNLWYEADWHFFCKEI